MPAREFGTRSKAIPPVADLIEVDMAIKDDGCELTPKEVAAMFSDPIWSAKFPPLLTVDEAAVLARVPKQTVYAWSSQGLLKGCSHKVGKHLRVLRDKFIQKLFSEGGLHGD